MIEQGAIRFPYPISANRYWRTCRGRTVVSAEAKAYKEHAAWLAKAAGWRVIDGDVAVQYILHPKLTKGGKASLTRLDLSNAVKVIEDAMNGIKWTDDKQVCAMCAVVGEPCKDGGITVMARELLKAG